MFSKDHIISEIRRTAQENSGRALGTARFEAETGIKASDWIGKYWARWSDAVVEAGFRPNALRGRRGDDEVLECLALFTRELGRLPVGTELKMKARNTKGFPSHTRFDRFGRKRTLAARLRDFAAQREYADVVALCDAAMAQSVEPRAQQADLDGSSGADSQIGYVYLLRSGRFYKVGRSNAVGRRERELAIQLPTQANVIHSIKTDDPIGIESYWHGRFADRRKNGEWFELTAKDVAAFKRRKFM